MVRPTYAEIDLTAVTDNVNAISRVIEPAAFCAVVKADAYGHGDVPVASAALGAGAQWLAVALVEEGVRLREGGIEAPILLLSEPEPGAALEIAKWELTPTAYSLRFIDELSSLSEPIAVQLKLDTGMHRVGAAPRLLHDLLAAVESSPRLEVSGVWTHFAVADEDRRFTTHQIEVFEEAAGRFDLPMTHLANTAGALLFEEARHDLCRIGLGMYGLHPTPDTWGLAELRPAMRLVTHVSHVQRLEAGARPSYGRIRELQDSSTVVTAPVGYADGYGRALAEYGCALIGGARFPLAGMVTMDQIVIDVGDAEVALGDEVVLLGAQGDQTISADEWAEELGTISYEVVCSIGPRVPRRYLP